MKKLFTIVLSLLGLASCDDQETNKSDPVVNTVGLHVLSDYGDKHRFITDKPTKEIVLQAINELDWENKFHQVIIVNSPSAYMEVGGSLNPSDGLSVLYKENGKQFVIKVPPKKIEDMSNFLLSYLPTDNSWKNNTEWE